MPNLTSVTSYFPQALENFSTTTSGAVSSGATTVPLTSVTNTLGYSYASGATVVMRINPSTPSTSGLFTGQISGTSVVNVVWISPYSGPFGAGAIVVDYASAGQLDMITTGLLKQHTQAGSHGAVTATSVTTSGSIQANGGLVVPTGQTITGNGFSAATFYNPYKFSVYLNSSSVTIPLSTNTIIPFDTVNYDTSSNFSTSTNLFTAPVAGFYEFNTAVSIPPFANSVVNLYIYKNGSPARCGAGLFTTSTTTQTYTGHTTGLQLAIGDTVGVYVRQNGGSGASVTPSNAQTYFEGRLNSAT